jgi:hypothetical protein
LSTYPCPENGLSGIRSVVKTYRKGYELPSQCIFQNKPPYGKDRQRHALYLTVFGFPSICTSEKTVRNTVKLSGHQRVKTLDAPQILFSVQYVMRLEAETVNVLSIIPSA